MEPTLRLSGGGGEEVGADLSSSKATSSERDVQDPLVGKASGMR